VTTVPILGVDAASATVPQAEHLIHDLISVLGLRADTLACTHFIREGRPHVAVSIEAPPTVDLGLLPAGAGGAIGDTRHGPAGLAASAAHAAAEHAARRSGRAVRYPGVAGLTGALTAAEIVARSAIDRIDVLAGAGSPDPATLVDTRGHVRPEWRDGRLTLLAMPAGEDRIAPFEVPNPTPCCADHG
jgi:hypothetical protein